MNLYNKVTYASYGSSRSKRKPDSISNADYTRKKEKREKCKKAKSRILLRFKQKEKSSFSTRFKELLNYIVESNAHEFKDL